MSEKVKLCADTWSTEQMDSTWEFHFLKRFKCVLIVRKMSLVRYLATCGPGVKALLFQCGMVFNECTHSSYHNGSTYDHPLPPVTSENVCIVIKWNGLTIFKVVILRLRCVFCELLFSLSLFPSLSVLPPTHTVGVIFGFQCTAKNVWICTGHFTRSSTCNSPNKQINDIKSNHCTAFRCLLSVFFCIF